MLSKHAAPPGPYIWTASESIGYDTSGAGVTAVSPIRIVRWFSPLGTFGRSIVVSSVPVSV